MSYCIGVKNQDIVEFFLILSGISFVHTIEELNQIW